MSTLFAFIFLLSIPILIVGLVKPSIFKLQSRKSAGLTFGGILAVSLILTGITAEDSTQTPVVTQKTTIATTTVAEVKPATLEDKIRPLAVRSGTTDISFKGIDNDKADSDRPVGSRMITVKLNITDFYSASALYKNTGNLTAKMFQEVFAFDPKFYDVIVWYYADTKDRYGNISSNIILSYATDRKTFEKINWSNFDSSKLCDFLKSEGSRNGGETVCVTKANIQ